MALLDWVERFADLVREYGMPVVMFSLGLIIFGWVVFDSDLLIEWKALIGLLLVSGGLGSQLWIYRRDNPPRYPDHPAQRALEKVLEQLTAILREQLGSAGSSQKDK